MKNQQRILTEAFTYSVRFSNLTSASSQTSAIQIHSDTDFEVFKLAANCFINLNAPNTFTEIAMGVHYAGLSVLMTENVNEARMSDVATPLCNVFGTGQQPFILPNPKILLANTVLSIQLSNLYAAQTIAGVELMFIGRKISVRSAA